MIKDSSIFIEHIIENITDIESFVKNVDKDKFLKNKEKQNSLSKKGKKIFYNGKTTGNGKKIIFK